MHALMNETYIELCTYILEDYSTIHEILTEKQKKMKWMDLNYISYKDNEEVISMFC
jgi:hypothetical protein